MLRQVYYRKTFLIGQLIGLILNFSLLQASVIEEIVFPPSTMGKYLSDQDSIKYIQGNFPSIFDELTQIGSTDSVEGTGKSSNMPPSAGSADILIPGIIRENGSCKITSSSTTSVEQKNLVGGIDRREPIKYPKTQEWPYCIQGHMIMKFPDNNYTGSGTLVGPHHVLTAGHNLYNPNNQKWAQKVFFSPGRDESHFPYGDNKGYILLVHEEWYKNGKDNYDFGMVILDSSIGFMTGWSGLLCLPDPLLKEWPLSVTGYPGDKGIGNYHSTQMWTMSETINDKSVKPEQLLYEIDTYDGQSGGGVWGERWPGYKGVYTVGIHTGKETVHAHENRGVRLSKGKFDIILSWLRAYQLESLPSILPSAQQAPIILDSLTFLDELGQEHESQRQRAKEEGEREALYHLGSFYYARKDYQKALTCFHRAAQKEYGPALTALGLCYELGEGVVLHPLKAVSLYQKARDKKNAEATRRLGLLYLEGRIFSKRVETAVNLLKEAARQGEGEASYRLADLYDKGQEVTQDKVYAAQFYQQAEKIGYFSSAATYNSIIALSEEEARKQVFTKLFHASLENINKIEELKERASSLTLFLCYDPEDKNQSQEVEKLAFNLLLSGIPEKNIYLDKWANRPGSNVTIFQHANRVFEATRVLVIGSCGLKEQYERKEGGRGISSLQIENLLVRITRQGVEGIIPLWLYGKQEECFPSTLQNIDQYFLGGDYYKSFFSFLELIFQCSITKNPIQSVKDDFENKRLALTSELLILYKTKVEADKKKQNEKHVNDLKNILGI